MSDIQKTPVMYHMVYAASISLFLFITPSLSCILYYHHCPGHVLAMISWDQSDDMLNIFQYLKWELNFVHTVWEHSLQWYHNHSPPSWNTTYIIVVSNPLYSTFQGPSEMHKVIWQAHSLSSYWSYIQACYVPICSGIHHFPSLPHVLPTLHIVLQESLIIIMYSISHIFHMVYEMCNISCIY